MKLITDRYEALRGLFATAELLDELTLNNIVTLKSGLEVTLGH